MSKAKVTPWFPPEVKPVRAGEYNASIAKNSQIRRWWNGNAWSLSYFTNSSSEYKRASRERRRNQAFQAPWRGLAEDPEASNGK